MEVINALGRRKAAVARVFVSAGTGKITINKRELETYFPSSILQFVVKQPLSKLGVAENYDIKVNLNGGGYKGQAEALLYLFYMHIGINKLCNYFMFQLKTYYTMLLFYTTYTTQTLTHTKDC